MKIDFSNPVIDETLINLSHINMIHDIVYFSQEIIFRSL